MLNTDDAAGALITAAPRAAVIKVLPLSHPRACV